MTVSGDNPAKQPISPDALAEIKRELFHGWLRFLLAVTLAVVLWLLLVGPGWNASNRDAVLPDKSNSLISIGIPEMQSTGFLQFKLMPTQPGSGDPSTISLYLAADGEGELSENPILLVTGELADSMSSCTGAGVAFRRNIAYEQLSEVSQEAALWQAREILVAEAVELNGNESGVNPSERKVTDFANREKYTEVEFATELESFTETTETESGESVSQLKHRRQINSTCSLRERALWENLAPEYRLKVPTMSALLPKVNESLVRRYLSAYAPTTTGFTIVNNTEAPRNGSDGTQYWYWHRSSDDSNQDQMSETSVGNFRMVHSEPAGAVFKNIVEEQREQSKIFTSGVALGVWGGLVVGALAILYEVLFVTGPKLRRASRTNETGSAGSADQTTGGQYSI